VTRVNENVSIPVFTDDALGEKKKKGEMIKTHLHRTNQPTNQQRKGEENKQRKKKQRKSRKYVTIEHYRLIKQTEV